MTQKYMNNQKLQQIANTLSKVAFGNPYPYSIIFVNPKEVNTAKFYPYADIPKGHEEECIIEVSKICVELEATSLQILCTGVTKALDYVSRRISQGYNNLFPHVQRYVFSAFQYFSYFQIQSCILMPTLFCPYMEHY